MTTTGADTQDLVIERVSAGDPSAYDTPDGPKKFDTRREIIHVRGGDDVVLTVRSTRHGPVISEVDVSAAAAARDKQVVALEATVLRSEDHTAEAFWGMNRAKDWDAFAAALAHFDTPMQNVFYADRNGTTAMMAPGLIPLRRTGNGFMPTPGWDDEAAWDGFIPFDDLPRRVDPASGVLVNANNRVVGDDYPFFISRDWDQPYRAQRIAELLGEAKNQTVARHQAIQLDTVSPMTAELLPLMLAQAEHSGRAAEALRRLAAWDGRMRRDTPEPLIFTTWLRALDRKLFADELGDLFPPLWDLHPKLIARTLRTEAAWCDDIRTPARESCAQQVTQAFAEALAALTEQHGSDLARWRWGDAHEAHHDHPIFGRIAVLRWLADLRIPADGGNDTVNRGAMRVADVADPFADIHGPGYRAVYDLADPAASRFVIATGQSGNPLSPHYSDFLQR
jgi:penicillin amidase